MFGNYHKEFLKKKIKLILNAFGNSYFVNKKILDVGAGNGDLSAVFFRLGNSVTSLDARKENLQYINKNYPGIKIFKQDLDYQPKITEKHTVIFHLGTLCHIGRWEENLRSSCENSTDLILETAVADVDSDFQCEMIEDSRIFDKSYSGKCSRASSKKIERVISESGMFLCRLDLPELNYQNNIYDWVDGNSGKQDLFLRRFWICSKNKSTIEKICKKYKVNLIESKIAAKEIKADQIVEKIEVTQVKANNESLPIVIENLPKISLNSQIILDKVSEKPEIIALNPIVEESKIILHKQRSKEKNTDGISIIIPAFNSSKFIDECIDSIKNQKCNFDVEIIIGVDHCQSTLDHIKSDVYRYEDVNVFWMEKNVGPYVVKNTLVDQAKYENILFFDSDDIMIDDALQKIYENIEDCIITFKYSNFNDRDGLSSAKEHNRFAEGVFFIKKSIFNSLNGFEPWKCAADTEFHERSKNNKIKYKNLNDIVFYRRVHDSSLTTSKDTNYRSQLRLKFSKIIVEKRNANNWKLSQKNIENLKKIKIENEKVDICVIISSYNRKEKLKNILNKLYWDDCKFSFRIILLNDGSTEDYNEFKSYNLDYIENESNNGKFKYWESINKLLDKVKKYDCEYVIQVDDDFILSNNFINNIINFFDKEIKKDNSVICGYYNVPDIKSERWGLGKNWIDGGGIYHINFIKKINYKIDPIPHDRWLRDKSLSSGVWHQISIKLNQYNYKVCSPEKSMIIHFGNEDSKMNKNIRDENPIYSNNQHIAVIMCVWKRIELLEGTLKNLELQTNKNFSLYLWNNNKEIVEEVNKIINHNYGYNIFVNHSEQNIGGIGRFYYANKIFKNFKKILFIDDDQYFDENLISNCFDQFEEKTIKSWWSHKIVSNNYYNRVRVTKENSFEEIDYCGTGGMLIDSSIFENEKIFECPSKYVFIEDLWLSFYAKYKLNWNLKNLNVHIKTHRDGKDQFGSIRKLKKEFYNFLLKNKENLILEKPLIK